MTLWYSAMSPFDSLRITFRRSRKITFASLGEFCTSNLEFVWERDFLFHKKYPEKKRFDYVFTLLYFKMSLSCISRLFSAGIYFLKVDNGNNRIILYEVCSRLTIKTPERRHWRCFGVFIVNFEQSTNIALTFLFLILEK